MEKIKEKATEYIMNYKDFQGTDEEWSMNVWELFNRKNNSNDVILLDVLQGGNDGMGFYPNFIKLIVKNECNFNWEEYLHSLKYHYRIYDVNVMYFVVDWNEDIDEYIVEVL